MKDDLGARILEVFLQTWDPERDLLLANDVREFARQQNGISDALRNGDLHFAFSVFQRIKARLEERTAVSLRLLEGGGFDFRLNEYLVKDPARRGWAQDRTSLADRWRRRVKNHFIELHLAGHPEPDIRRILRARYIQLRNRGRGIDTDTVVERVVDAYARAVDQHGAFLSGRAIQDLRIRTTGAFEGIGVTLGGNGELAVIERLVPGGPADRSQELDVGDRIIGIGQAGEPWLTDVVGWPIAEVAERLRGPAGTSVKLQVLPSGIGAAPRMVTLMRARVTLEDQVPQVKIYRPLGVGPEVVLIAVVEVPSFHTGSSAGQAQNDNSTSNQLRRIVRTLRVRGVDGLVLDLRRNPGGSLGEAVQSVGLFVTTGPIVQVRTHAGEILIYEDPDPTIEWNGALSVLVGPKSASASEIVAAAIQDYKRGLIVGARTFGKGSAQSIIPLRKTGVEGALRLTTSRLFRVTGESIEELGVEPDVSILVEAFPAWYHGLERRQQSRIGAVRWDRGSIDSRTAAWVRQLSRKRIASSQPFEILRDEMSECAALGRQQSVVSLNLEIRRYEHRHCERRLRRNTSKLTAALPGYEMRETGGEAKSLAALKDALVLDETIRITADLTRLWKPH